MPRRLLTIVLGPLRRSAFARNWSFLVVSSLLGQALGMLATMRIARALGPEGYGEFNLVQVVAALAGVAASLGLNNVIIREVARRPERSGTIFFTSMAIRAGTVVLASAGIVIYERMNQDLLPEPLVAVAIGMLLGQIAWDTIEGVTFGHEQMEHAAGVNLAGSALWVIAIWATPMGWLTAGVVSASFAALQVGKAAAFGYLVGKRGHFRGPAVTGALSEDARSLLTQTLPFYWLALLTAVSNQLPTLFLADRAGPAEVGLYNAGFRLITPMQTFISSALVALYPGLAKAGVANEEQFVTNVRRALLSMALIGVAGSVIVALFRNELVVVIFGPRFQDAANAMVFQTWFVAMYAIYCLIGTVLAARDRQKWLAWLSTAYGISSVPILWWSAGEGATGLSAGRVVVAVLGFSYHWVYFQRAMPRHLPALDLLSAIGIFAVGAAASAMVPPSAPFMLRLAGGVAVGAAIGWLLWSRLGVRRTQGRQESPEGDAPLEDGVVPQLQLGVRVEVDPNGSRRGDGPPAATRRL